VRLLVLDRYIARELVSPFAFGCALFTFFLVIDRIYHLTDLVITKGVPFYLVAQLLVYMLPSFLAHTLPMALLVAVLLAGGRLPRLAGRVGGGLGVWPLFELGGGRVRPLRPARSRAAAEARIVERWRASRGGDADLHVAAVHALAPERAERLLAAVRAELQPATAFVGEFDAAMASHSGPGAAALAWWWEPRA